MAPEDPAGTEEDGESAEHEERDENEDGEERSGRLDKAVDVVLELLGLI